MMFRTNISGHIRRRNGRIRSPISSSVSGTDVLWARDCKARCSSALSPKHRSRWPKSLDCSSRRLIENGVHAAFQSRSGVGGTALAVSPSSVPEGERQRNGCSRWYGLRRLVGCGMHSISFFFESGNFVALA